MEVKKKMKKKRTKIEKATIVASYPFGVFVTQTSNPFIKKSKRISFKKLNKAYKNVLKN